MRKLRLRCELGFAFCSRPPDTSFPDPHHRLVASVRMVILTHLTGAPGGMVKTGRIRYGKNGLHTMVAALSALFSPLSVYSTPGPVRMLQGLFHRIPYSISVQIVEAEHQRLVLCPTSHSSGVAKPSETQAQIYARQLVEVSKTGSGGTILHGSLVLCTHFE